ncbi:MAG: hypothetical protein A2268_16490 [Candidatus Raymondbacteria bacterium RifOxyA12_full_50_37]|uniref:Uncharacterized protein n=1 Tax=Candidatus Raymondbacteria bacterium RIFOXYD12_FULL_49_13 TaxID=1817890 RepID=A0A1F7F491_UNCRA|nr:MAG: hypothetical protein A2268_16490 [Candidatus Raymondbacteria bacterium RifOxyA12_full_50_37]OGJ86210.1 MAG: hypothetical protein A2248_16080 [Candidatus Raymondbacteria bacterium RIFOXYA2_FULL_49_16]OGJ95748.1 MAG: hypothetical protein A2453_11400 [Candidatus Raymondbacteria bacterium RIFOXYC2_FULL_50_21]OGJ98020.1 MAG: hypothetical protein A2487_20590 [Candidatus Raymondbacteria bacterium RifOxyC12_full_50_8]OGJ98338.1 MAG: hypothetical protein A2350_01505 [Candidatus Raymondbacteria b
MKPVEALTRKELEQVALDLGFKNVRNLATENIMRKVKFLQRFARSNAEGQAPGEAFGHGAHEAQAFTVLHKLRREDFTPDAIRSGIWDIIQDVLKGTH